MKRRNFIATSIKGSLALSMGIQLLACKTPKMTKQKINPIAICTWGFVSANEAAGKALDAGMNALDASIVGVAVEEENIKNTTVGKGGAPDREGNVTLDATVMDHTGNCGAVVCVEDYTNVAAIAKKVMTETPHVMLAGKGAEEFAAKQGFQKENLLTESSENAYREWLKTSQYKPIINIENHDTIGMVCMDGNGDISGACSTSGLSYKMKGRVGDSPIIGAGLFIDNEIGGAAATGMGEEIMKSVGSFLIVELMRNGMSPQEACEEAVMRTIRKNPGYKDFQVAYIAMNKKGETGSFCIHKGFSMMEYREGTNRQIPSSYYLKD
ncbi:glycosylasparaginase [Nonlabens sp. YIK11]|uniref:N(4)-(beta-N-acetylglucosaminyl)-L-asparaginase n=1 Tax=Nonlabens sp. YIK11 TaxID=1453349 RepID=UPI0006DC5D9B|nr:N(4)-(beta-N-acetylglucosaminyl)-L-asparaginase [Nonlabens sp. YIK11]KQC32745.1 glycosylasparaginase [Nonlabens sp. YIK11]